MARITNRFIRIQSPEAVLRMEQEMADAEMEFLKKVRAYQEFKQERLPRVAAERDAMIADSVALMRVLEAGKNTPVLANMPLLEMKAQILNMRDPLLEDSVVRLNPKHAKHRIFPIPLGKP